MYKRQPLDKYHRSKKIFKHVLGTAQKEDSLIFEEKDDSFSVNISLTADEKFFVITSSDSNTVEEYFFLADEQKTNPKLFKAREKGVKYSIDSWKSYWYMHTNKNAPDYQVLRCKHKDIEKWQHTFTGIQYHDEEHDFLLYGGVDDIMIDEDDKLVVIDFKATAKKADILSLSLPLNSKTKNFITLKEMKLMKNSSIIINAARGGIIHEEDLDKALNENLIFGAGIDVFKKEPRLRILTPRLVKAGLLPDDSDLISKIINIK